MRIKNKPKIVAIIPARGGSKGLLRKNIRLLGGKPLIVYSIEASLKSEWIDATIVSSEDEEIMAVAEKYGAEVIKRPKYLAADLATSAAVVDNLLKKLKKAKRFYDILILLQPTSPLRDEQEVDRAIKTFIEHKEATALISVKNLIDNPYKYLKLNASGFLSGLVNDQLAFLPRQSLPMVFSQDGAIYIVKVSEFLKSKNFLTSRTIPFFLPSKKIIDIDFLTDFKKAERILKHGKL